jgi:hypothetical protein
MKLFLSSIFTIIAIISLDAQNRACYWQQKVDYRMEIDMDVNSYLYKGKQELVYTNNSPDTLNRVFYHLYFNAFQPGSEMDVRSRTISDPDRRVGDRISKLKPDEIGYINPTSLSQDGIALKYEVVGTILEVALNKSILPGQSTLFKMDWDGQVPVQIRRSGRNNSEGVKLSMTQWYPKLAEYDFEGWHADPYIGREFYGVWGDFDVKITIDENYTIGGTGYLQNPAEIGHGYQLPDQKAMKPKNGKYTWHFVAPNVHDFTWAADPDYAHDTLQVPDGPLLHFFYKNTMAPENIAIWKKLQPKAVELMQYYNEHIGRYPYDQYSIIQGGDGGMEYGMCTLVLGGGTFDGLFKGTISHEMAHAWFQFLLATNEAKHEWMDEGFATYVEYKAMNEMFDKKMENPWEETYMVYKSLATSGFEQPQTTYADRYSINRAYSYAAYYKGSVFLSQLGYIVGEENLEKIIKRYYSEWKFKHPTPNDFIRVAEKVSGFELDWYLTDWTQTTNTIDYEIKSVVSNGDVSQVTLARNGLMPMPIDLYVTYEDGSLEAFYIPLQMMRGEKPNPYPNLTRTILIDWAWAYPEYVFEINNGKKVKNMMIDIGQRMADINLENNIYEQ